MKNILVNHYLKLNKDLIGENISLSKTSEILLFFELCRIKQMEVIAKSSVYCNEFDSDLTINKDKLEYIFGKDIIKQNSRMLALQNNGVKFGNDIIIHQVIFDQRRGEFSAEFDEDNFMKHFIYIDKNFTKVPISMFCDLRSKNSTMLLLWILKFSNSRGYKFISKDGVCKLLGKDSSIRDSDLKRDIRKSLEQISKFGIINTKDDKIKISIDKNNNISLPVIQFDVNIKLEKIKDKPKKEKVVYDVTEEEIRLYANNENNS